MYDVGDDFVNLSLLAFYCFAIFSTPFTDDQRETEGWRLLAAFAPAHAYTQLYHFLITLAKAVFLRRHGPGHTDMLPGEDKIQCLAVFYTLAVFAKFALQFGIAVKFFPTRDCGSLTYWAVCISLRIAAVMFVLYVAFVAMGVCLWCCGVCVNSVREGRSRQHGPGGSMQGQMAGAMESGLRFIPLPVSIRSALIKKLPITSEPPEGDVCAVCLETGGPGASWRMLPCGHRFHPDCSDGWLAENGTCPTCRSDATQGLGISGQLTGVTANARDSTPGWPSFLVVGHGRAESRDPTPLSRDYSGGAPNYDHHSALAGVVNVGTVAMADPHPPFVPTEGPATHDQAVYGAAAATLHPDPPSLGTASEAAQGPGGAEAAGAPYPVAGGSALRIVEVDGVVYRGGDGNAWGDAQGQGRGEGEGRGGACGPAGDGDRHGGDGDRHGGDGDRHGGPGPGEDRDGRGDSLELAAL